MKIQLKRLFKSVNRNVGESIVEEPNKMLKAEIRYNTTVIKSGGDSQMFIGRFYDEKGNEVQGVIPHWTVTCDFSNKLIVKEFDNGLSIGIDDDSYIDEEFKLTLSVEDKKYNIVPSSLLIKIESLL